ncbi:MAG: CinA family protein [Spirochaetaceae bacterium]|jgi:PncC family amidohydrolase|nr:CinA family protein [Spirochaetaceae bacterium]
MTPAEILIKRLTVLAKTAVLAESCTGGLASDALVRVPGASRVFWGGFICYTLEAKTAMLGVDRDLLRRYGAVSPETACAMAQGALERSGADFAAAVTGIAGPEGDGTDTPLGTVWIGTAVSGRPPQARRFHYPFSREGVRTAAAEEAVKELLALTD